MNDASQDKTVWITILKVLNIDIYSVIQYKH